MKTRQGWVTQQEDSLFSITEFVSGLQTPTHYLGDIVCSQIDAPLCYIPEIHKEKLESYNLQRVSGSIQKWESLIKEPKHIAT